MNRLLFMNFVSLVVVILRSQECESKHLRAADDGKIVGGYNSTIQNIPYQVYILLQRGNDYFQCGGSIINRRTVLTAAHCVSNIQKAYIRAGSTESDNGGKVYTSSDLRQHPRYNASASDYDVAIIKLSTPMTLDGTNIKAVKLARRGSSVPKGTELLVSGWGTTSENGDTSRTLMAVKVPVISNKECRQSYTGFTSRMLCAGVEGKDSCQGDSGGPAVTEKNGIQHGIVSFGIGCARAGYPGVYTRVSAVRTWIDLNSRT